MDEPLFSESMSLGEAKIILRRKLDDGIECPLCARFAKLYRRKLHKTMVVALINFYRENGLKWADWPTRQSDEAKLRYWKLIDQGIEGTPSAGLWRITMHGVRFIESGEKVLSHARVYNGRCLGLVGELVAIEDVLGRSFDLAELMAA